jgi:ribonuclease T2
MVRFIARGVLARGVLALSLFAAMAGVGLAQDKRQNQPGQFDFYVLSLSWSPSFCAASAERSPERAPGMQCGTRAYSFIVLGLWPQYESGFPEYCQVPAPRLDHPTISGVLDLMPEPRLIFTAWDRHGTCSGLSAHAYFDTLRKARAFVKIPAEYLNPQQPLTVSPAAVQSAFHKANPDLAPADMAVACDATRLTEVRLCLSKDLKFRACPEVVQHSCQREQVLMPAPHATATDAGRRNAGGGSG